MSGGSTQDVFYFPGGGGGTPANPNLFDLYTSFGHGISTEQELPANTSFWLSPTTDADNATADQAREWITESDLGFVQLDVFIPAAVIQGEIGIDFIVTVDGADTAIKIHFGAGTITNTKGFQSALLIVKAPSTLGVRVDASDVDSGSSMRAQVHLRGAATGEPSNPTELPATPLALYTPTSLAADGTTWGDETGNLFDAAVPVVVGAGAPTISDINGHRAAQFNGIKQVLSTQNGMFTGGPNPIAPRTMMAVVQPDNQTGGTVGCFNETADYCSFTLWKTAGNQYSYENGSANNSQLSSVVNYGGTAHVLVWRTDGVSVEFYVDGVRRPAVTDACGPDNGIAPGFVIGNNLANFGDRGWLGKIDFIGVWARRWDDDELLAGVAFANANYL